MVYMQDNCIIDNLKSSTGKQNRTEILVHYVKITIFIDFEN